MTVALKPKLTQSGMRAISAALLNGETEVKISHIALGDGNGAGYSPVGNEISLKNELTRVAVGGGKRISDFQIQVESLFQDAADPTFNIHELGIYLEDGTLLGVWSDQLDTLGTRNPKYQKTIISFDLVLSDIPAGSVNVSVTGPSVNILFDYPVLTSLKAIASLQLESIKTKITAFDAALK